MFTKKVGSFSALGENPCRPAKKETTSDFERQKIRKHFSTVSSRFALRHKDKQEMDWKVCPRNVRTQM